MENNYFRQFLKLYTAATGQEVSFVDAKSNHTMVEFAKGLEELMKSELPKVKKSESTKKRSYAKMCTGEADVAVFETILTYPDMSRSDLSKLTGYRLQTICGCVNRLLQLKAIVVNGEKVDNETRQTVQVLSVNPEVTEDNKIYY